MADEPPQPPAVLRFLRTSFYAVTGTPRFVWHTTAQLTKDRRWLLALSLALFLLPLFLVNVRLVYLNRGQLRSVAAGVNRLVRARCALVAAAVLGASWEDAAAGRLLLFLTGGSLSGKRPWPLRRLSALFAAVLSLPEALGSALVDAVDALARAVGGRPEDDVVLGNETPEKRPEEAGGKEAKQGDEAEEEEED